jgi:hypothetical protein
VFDQSIRIAGERRDEIGVIGVNDKRTELPGTGKLGMRVVLRSRSLGSSETVVTGTRFLV